MRRDNHVPQLKQRMCCVRGLGIEHVEPSAAQAPARERPVYRA